MLDEPSIGLHQRDNERLLIPQASARSGNSGHVVVEHDQTLSCWRIMSSIWPWSGWLLAAVAAEGTPTAIQATASLTGQYLSGKCSKHSLHPHSPNLERMLTTKSANFTGTAQSSTGLFAGSVRTGVSGSGKPP
ncbi:MAG: hypothetical protein P0107_01525 [Nitrosomonas sp.]|nr:hypothetical protein [Nitrosomonas sp.]